MAVVSRCPLSWTFKKLLIADMGCPTVRPVFVPWKLVIHPGKVKILNPKMSGKKKQFEANVMEVDGSNDFLLFKCGWFLGEPAVNFQGCSFHRSPSRSPSSLCTCCSCNDVACIASLNKLQIGKNNEYNQQNDICFLLDLYNVSFKIKRKT